MSVQTNYSYSTQKGIPGGLYDQSPYVIDTRLNEADSGEMLLGMGVVQGSSPGTNINLPAVGAVAETFEGVTVNGFTAQHDLEGNVSLMKKQSVGILRHGRIYVRLVGEITPAYGDKVHLCISGDDAGRFTNVADTDASTTVAIEAKFIGGAVAGDIAAIELFGV